MLQVSLNSEEVTLSPSPRTTQAWRKKRIQHLNQIFILIFIFVSTIGDTGQETILSFHDT